jgi:hypothetical protein
MMDFSERLAEHTRLALLLCLAEDPRDNHIRLCILRLLAALPAGMATNSLIRDGLEDFGHRLAREEVNAQVAWLNRADLVAVHPLGAVPGAVLLDLGRDAAEGRIRVPDVAELPNAATLAAKLAVIGLAASVADAAVHLEHLARHGCVLITAAGGAGCLDKGGSAVAVMITAKGRDAAAGRVRIDGVKAPSSATIMQAAASAARDRLGG